MSLQRTEVQPLLPPSSKAATLVDLLRQRALHQPHRTAYIFLRDGESEESLTYGELDTRARAIAVQLQSTVAQGQRVLLLYPSGLEFISAFWGCIYAGVVAVPAYPPRANRSLTRLQAIVTDAGAAAALTTDTILSRLDPLLKFTNELNELRWMTASSSELAEEWVAPGIDVNTLAFLQYTSGSTAAPKGVMVSHGNLLHNEELIRRVFRQSEESVIVGWLPLYHDMGLIGNVLQPLFLGARCILFSPTTFLQQPYRWLEAISRYRATTSGGPNFAYDLCVARITAAERATLDLSSWTTAFNGAEPIRAETLKRFAHAFGTCGFRPEAFYPCYGLAEATLLVTGKLNSESPSVQAVDAKALEQNRVVKSSPGNEGVRLLVGCGNLQADQRIVVVNPQTLAECRPDEVGEILISGPSIAHGYWNQPEASEKTFRARLADGDQTTQFLRTGDLGFISDAELFITGRAKDLIIIRGRNHYPQDIELTVESSHKALRRGCGAAFSISILGEERLVVVQELKPHQMSEANQAIRSIRAAIADEHELAPFAVVLIKTATIPKTSSGKIRRNTCREEFLSGTLSTIAEWRESESDADGPQPAELTATLPLTTEALVSWLRERLALATRINAAEIEVDHSIAIYGLDSLAAITLAHSIESELGVELQFTDLLQDISLNQLAALLSEKLRQESVSDISPRPAIAECDLTHGQRSLWFLHQMAPASTAYHLVNALNVTTEFDVTALRRSFQALVQRHPALRTTFSAVDGKPFQRVHEQSEVCFEEHAGDWTDDDLNKLLVSTAYRPFDLENGPPFRVTLYKRSTRAHVLLIALHHIVADFWSMALMIQELGVLYAAELNDETPFLPPVAALYTDVIRSERELCESPRGEQEWSYWQQQLAIQPPALSLPYDYVREPVQTFSGSSHSFRLNAEVTRRLKDLSRTHGVTLYTTLLAVFQVLLQRYTGETDIAVGTPTAGRTRPDWAGLVGYFVNPIVVRGDLSGDPTFGSLLERTWKTALAAFEHSDYPFALLVERLQPSRDTGRSPFFQVMFVLQKAHLLDAESLGLFALGEAGARVNLGPLCLESRPLEERVAPFDLTLALTESDGGLTASLEYNTGLFKHETIERLGRHYSKLVESVGANPNLRISELEMLADDERRHVLFDLNRTEHDLATAGLSHQLFEEQAQRTPAAIAVKCGEQHTTYAELNRRANQLAHHLLSLGVEPESRVALLLDRSLDLVIGALAVLKAGAAYVPLDPSYPQERLRYMLRDANAGLLLMRSDMAAGMSDCNCRIVFMDQPFESGPAADTNPALPVCGESLAYVIYTSGSTGVPKGVAVQHDSLMNLICWHQRTYDITPADRATLIAAPGFDASVWEIWPYLTAGASLHIPDEETRTSPAKLVAWLTAEAISICFLPTPLAELVIDEDWTSKCPINFSLSRKSDKLKHVGHQTASLPSLRLLLTGGDKLRRWLEKPFPFRLVNHYGPTENTVVATAAEVGAATGQSALPPIGQPIDNTRAYLLTSGLQPVPQGVVAELYLSGDSLARGYLNRPEATAERFTPDPFASQPGARMYRTGDLARRLPNGEIEYRGRVDQQVKLRGFRVELGEIEAVLATHPLVSECLVVPVEQSSGEHLLAAYFTASVGVPSPIELREFLGRWLPEYMQPSAFIAVDAWPLTRNGKIDLKALPVPLADESDSNYIAPRTPTEEVLTEIWAALLNLERVGIATNFFSAGGHSLLAAQLVSRVRTTFNVELPLRSVFVSPTPQLLAVEIERLIREARGVTMPPLRRIERGGPLQLSFAQQRLWFLDKFEPAGPHYNIAAAVKFTGQLDVEALERSLVEITQRHEVLRTTFGMSDEKPVQHIAATSTLHLPKLDLRRAERRDEEAQALLAGEARRVFDLESGPLMRVMLLQLDQAEHILMVTMHHIISDGWSMGVLIKELTTLYNGFSSGAQLPLAELPVQYADFAHWQREWLQGDVLDQDLRYWQQQLSGMSPLLQLRTDYARPPVQTFRGARVSLRLDQDLTASLNAVSRAHDVTLFMTLLATLGMLLMRYTRETDINIGTPVAGRTLAETEGLIGFFVNTLVLRTDLSGEPTFTELLVRMRELCLGAYQHQELPFEQLVEALQPERDLNRTPLFQVMLVLHNSPLPQIELDGVRAEVMEVETGTSKIETTFTFREEANGILSGTIDYQTDLFSRETVKQLAANYLRLLQSAVADPQRRITELDLFDEHERRQLLEQFNQTTHEYPEVCLHKLFEAQAERTPEAIAAVCDENQITYAELNTRADRVAGQLRSRGVAAETLVGVMMERSVELVIALLGILKAGGAYVPVDPSYPRERIDFILDDAQIDLVLTERGLQASLIGLSAEVLCIDELVNADFPVDSSAAREATADNLAYLIYTSGSSGAPKGVMVTHRAICNHLQWRQRAYPLNAGDRFLHKASISFDISVWEIFGPLIAGAQLILAKPRGQQDSEYLVHLMAQQGVTVAHFGPSVLDTILREPEIKSCRHLRRVFCGGESLTEMLRHRFFETFPHDVSLHHQYGPTETTVDVAVWDCEIGVGGDPRSPVSIGHGIDNSRLYVLDDRMQPVPGGVTGELYAGGVPLARGYWRRPDLTAEKFVPDPFAAEPGGRLYRTGDLVWRQAGGQLEYVARTDQQVKLRGYRIELGEVEAVLRTYDGVRDCVVVVRGEGEDRRLIAYLVSEQVATDAIRAYLKQRLPEFMLPQTYVTLRTLPLTVNGKIDRKALPAPEQLRPQLEKPFIAPRNEVERLIAAIWVEILEVDQVGVHDNFFDLGGHSLMATRVHARLRRTFNHDLPLRTLFEKPTVAELATYIDTAKREVDPYYSLPLQRVSRDGALPLSFAQQRLWFLSQLAAGRSAYNIPTAVRLSGVLDEQALRRGLNEMVRRHEALRTAYLTVNGEPRQVISEAVEVVLEINDLIGIEEQPTRAQQLAAAEAGAAFDLGRAPLLRARLLRLGPEEQMLVVVFHHIVSDGWSLGVFVRELCALYEAYRSGKESPLPELALQYVDFAHWQRERLSGMQLAGELVYWRERLGEAPEPLALATDRVRPSVPRFAGATQTWALGRELTERLKELSRSQEATLFMTLLAGLQTLLWRYSGQEQISVGTPVAGRTRSETEELIGFFVNTLVMRTDLSGEPSFVELLARVREVCLGAYQHQELPFEQLVQALQPQREVSRTPLFQVMLVLQNMPLPPVQLSGLKSEIVNIDSGESKFELSLYLRETDEGLTGIIEYQTELFDDDTIKHLGDHLKRLLEDVSANPHKRISELEMLSDDEHRQFTEDWNHTRRGYALSEACLHQLFEEQVRHTPDAIAITYGDEHLTYADLNYRANQLARLLRQKGVSFESRVGLLLPRSTELVVSALAVLKSGAAYLPLDPTHPVERLSYCVKDAGASVLITTKTHLLQDVFESWGVREVIKVDRVNLEGFDGADLGLPVFSENLAYVIYTSGSTGTPKGVLGLHRGACNRFHWMWENYPFEPDDVCCQKTSVVFVDFVWELFGPLLKGVRTVIMPDNVASDPRRFVQELADAGVTRLVLVPSLLSAMLETQDDLGRRLSKLRLCVVSGEALPTSLAQRFCEQLPHCKLLNLYGSSEVSADVTCCEVSAQLPTTNSIGRPIDNTQIYLLDKHLQPVPRVAWGELYAGGVNLARGYCNRPELTAEKFVPNPFSSVPGERMYRTGDRARYLRDGQIEFRGRVDQQFKLRGFRIEPAEIEAALVSHPQINKALVALRGDTPSEKRLLAYLVVSDLESPPGVEQLRSHLRGRLPEYMLPSEFLFLDSMPLTPTGKVDRLALSTAKGKRARIETDYVPPQTEVERTIVTIFQEVIGVDRVGLNDNFFELGGHSLLLVKLQNRLQTTFKRDVSLVELIEYPTAGALTKYFSNGKDEGLSVDEVQSRLNKQWAALSRRKQLIKERGGVVS